MKKTIFDLPEFRNQTRVFRDRGAAGKILAEMLEAYRNSHATVLAIPAGGVAVAAVIAKGLNLSLDLAVVSKITPSWNSEVGYGAVAFDGTVMLNEDLVSRLHLSRQEIQEGIRRTEEKVARRVTLLRGNRLLPNLQNPVLLVDDGLASGFTIRVAIKALRGAGSRQIILAVPTAHEASVRKTSEEVEAVYCPNIRSGPSFAVADAYEYWRDVDEAEMMDILAPFFKSPQG